jgi:hypothetical protein
MGRPVVRLSHPELSATVRLSVRLSRKAQPPIIPFCSMYDVVADEVEDEQATCCSSTLPCSSTQATGRFASRVHKSKHRGLIAYVYLPTRELPTRASVLADEGRFAGRTRQLRSIVSRRVAPRPKPPSSLRTEAAGCPHTAHCPHTGCRPARCSRTASLLASRAAAPSALCEPARLPPPRLHFFKYCFIACSRSRLAGT